MYVNIAIHYAEPDCINDFFAFVAKVEVVAQGSPGMLRLGSWRDEGSSR